MKSIYKKMLIIFWMEYTPRAQGSKPQSLASALPSLMDFVSKSSLLMYELQHQSYVRQLMHDYLPSTGQALWLPLQEKSLLQSVQFVANTILILVQKRIGLKENILIFFHKFWPIIHHNFVFCARVCHACIFIEGCSCVCISDIFKATFYQIDFLKRQWIRGGGLRIKFVQGAKKLWNPKMTPQKSTGTFLAGVLQPRCTRRICGRWTLRPS